MKGYSLGFRFVASFGFGGQESASKPPQAICKPFNLTKKQKKASANTVETNLSQLVISLEVAREIQKIGITKKSIFAYYRKGKSATVQIYDTEVDFICYAYTFEEIVQFIPEHIEVDKNTYIARFDSYDQLGEPEEGQYDFATVTFQRTEVLKTPYMSICMCRGRMVAFSKTKDGYYNNLICWGKNQAETAALMILELKKENKFEIKNGR